MKAIFTVALLLLCMLLSACAGSNFSDAQRQNTIPAYENFLRQFPDSEFTPNARAGIQNIKFDEARKIGTPEAYDAFLKEYQTGYNADRARELRAKGLAIRTEDNRYEDAKKTGTRAALEAYLREYPSGRWIGSAEKLIDASVDAKTRKEYEEAALQAASAWVGYLDAGKWREASEQTTPDLVQMFGGSDGWVKLLQSLREAGSGMWGSNAQGGFSELGPKNMLRVVSRKTQSAQFLIKYGKLPLGDYVLVTFDTVFDRVRAEELVAFIRTSDNRWLNVNYFVKYTR